MKTEIQQGTIHLKGFTRFNVYATEPHRVIVDPEQMFLICEAELTFTDSQSFVVTTRDFMPAADGNPPALYRVAIFEGKMSPDGQVKYSWPESWWEPGATMHDLPAIINLHTGYVFSGPDTNKKTVEFSGNFDGVHFNAGCKVNAIQEKPGSFPAYQEVVEGPIMFCISIELQKV